MHDRRSYAQSVCRTLKVQPSVGLVAVVPEPQLVQAPPLELATRLAELEPTRVQGRPMSTGDRVASRLRPTSKNTVSDTPVSIA